MSGNSDERGATARAAPAEATRKRVAVETYARHEATLRRTARRYSLCADDAEDALQRGLEILLRKAPSEDPRELIRWTQTVVKHEALAIRRERERILAAPAGRESGPEDWIALIPSDSDGPPERAERREAIARSREALRALKPQELRALTLLAEGFSYEEISAETGWTRTKVNRCLAEGRARFRALLSRSEDGSRCAELASSISAFSDGEASAEESAMVRDHLHACLQCRSTLRAYRAAPAAAAAVAPTLPLDRTLLERVHDLVASAASRFGGSASTDSTLTQLAGAGGARGAGAVALAKATAICVSAIGGAACVASGVVPVALPLAGDQSGPQLERRGDSAANPAADAPVEEEPMPAAPPPAPVPAEPSPVESPPIAASPPEASSGAVEYDPQPPAATAPPATVAPNAGGGDPAGEFGP